LGPKEGEITVSKNGEREEGEGRISLPKKDCNCVEPGN